MKIFTKNLLVLVVLILITTFGYGQTKVSTGTGVWSNAATWSPSGVPTASDNVFIEPGHTITVDGNFDCADLNISTSGVAAVGANTLTVNGKIRAYTGAAPGTSSGSPGVNCITTTTTGKVVYTFAGAITSSSEWGAFTTSYRAEFAITGGGTATIGTNFKAGDIIISSGTLNASNNNIQPDFGSANTGTLTINSGAKLQFTSGRIQRTGTAGTTCSTITVNGTLEYTGTIINGAFAVTYNTSQGTLAYTAIGAQTLLTTIINVKNLIIGGSGTKTYSHTSNLQISNDGTVRIDGNATCIFDATGTGLLAYGTNCTLICNSTAGFYNLDGTLNNFDIWPATNGPQNITVLGNNVGNVFRLENSGFDRTIPGTLLLNGGGLTVRNGAIIRFGNDANIIRNTANGELKNVSTGFLHFGTGSPNSVDVTINVPCTATQELPTFGTQITGQIGTFTINGDYTVDPAILPATYRPVTDLIMTTGKIILGQDNILGVTNLITGASSSNYVVTSGTGSGLRRPVAATLVQFPVGPTTTLYHPATITNSGTADDYTVNVSSTTPPCAAAIYTVNATWDIAELVTGGSNCDITLDYNGATVGGSYNASVAKIAHCTGGTADYKSGSVTGTIASGTGFTTFSPFAITSDPVVLPIALLNFSGKKTNTGIQLQWSTATEQNNKGFEILRSTDGINFTPIAFINSNAINGNSSTKINYLFTDVTATAGKFFYRINQLDKDLRSRLSTIIAIDGNAINKLVVSNLVVNQSNLTALIASPSQQQISYVIFDATGKKIVNETMTVQGGTNVFSMPTHYLHSGIYMLTIISASEKITNKFVK